MSRMIINTIGEDSFDVVVCGGGTAGFCAAIAAARTGVKTAVIERFGAFGGTMTVGGVNAPALLYNKTLLDGAGITVKDNMTMDEFFALSQEIYEKTGVKTNVGFGTNMVLNYMVRGLGNELFTDGKLSATAEEIEYYFSIYEKGIKEGWMVGSEVFAETTVGTVGIVIPMSAVPMSPDSVCPLMAGLFVKSS